MAKNAYAKRLDAARAAREYAIRRYTRQQMLDFVTIALGRMGYGEKRLKDFEQMLSAVAEDVLTRWSLEKQGVAVNRELPKSYLYFTGTGRENIFREAY